MAKCNRSSELEGGNRTSCAIAGALLEAKDAVGFVEPTPAADEERIFAIGSGDVAVFPGRADRNPATPMVLVATSYIPFPLSHGGAVRMYNLMRRAAPRFSRRCWSRFVDELHTPAEELLDICVGDCAGPTSRQPC